jgi:primosomal protein N''
MRKELRLDQDEDFQSEKLLKKTNHLKRYGSVNKIRYKNSNNKKIIHERYKRMNRLEELGRVIPKKQKLKKVKKDLKAEKRKNVELQKRK